MVKEVICDKIGKREMGAHLDKATLFPKEKHMCERTRTFVEINRWARR